jgi:hypothetical protein
MIVRGGAMASVRLAGARTASISAGKALLCVLGPKFRHVCWPLSGLRRFLHSPLAEFRLFGATRRFPVAGRPFLYVTGPVEGFVGLAITWIFPGREKPF